jgi:hypothetical protein
VILKHFQSHDVPPVHAVAGSERAREADRNCERSPTHHDTH